MSCCSFYIELAINRSYMTNKRFAAEPFMGKMLIDQFILKDGLNWAKIFFFILSAPTLWPYQNVPMFLI